MAVTAIRTLTDNFGSRDVLFGSFQLIHGLLEHARAQI